jgi:chaperonin GroES
MDLRLKPLSDRVVVEWYSREEVSRGGIIVPPTDRPKHVVAHVVAVGPGPLVDGVRRPMEVRAGDLVIVDMWMGRPVYHKGEKFYVYPESECLCRLEASPGERADHLASVVVERVRRHCGGVAAPVATAIRDAVTASISEEEARALPAIEFGEPRRGES